LNEQQCRMALSRMTQDGIYVSDDYTVLVFPESTYRTSDDIYFELRDKYGDISDFANAYQFIPKDELTVQYVYMILSQCYSKHFDQKVLFPFNIDLYKALFDMAPSNIDKSKLTIHQSGMGHKKLYPFHFKYVTSSGRILYQPDSIKKVSNYPDKEVFSKFIEGEYKKLLDSSKQLFKLLSISNDQSSIDKIIHVIDNKPSMTVFKKAITFLNKHTVDTLIKTRNYLYIDDCIERLTPEEMCEFDKLVNMCLTFSKSPIQYTFDGIQIKIFQTKSHSHIVFQPYFDMSTDLVSSDNDCKIRLYKAMQTIGKWDELFQRVENEALVNL